jgi:hypothetical protein
MGQSCATDAIRGHAFAGDVVLAAQGEGIEKMLISLQRVHQGLAVRERAQNRNALADRLENRPRGYEEDALLGHELMRSGFAGGSLGGAEGGGKRGNDEGQG